MSDYHLDNHAVGVPEWVMLIISRVIADVAETVTVWLSYDNGPYIVGGGSAPKYICGSLET